MEKNKDDKLLKYINNDEQSQINIKIMKINKNGKKQQRNFILTNKAIYNIDSGSIIKPLKRRIEISKLEAITVSCVCQEFILHIQKEYDYRYEVHSQRELLIKTIAENYEKLANQYLKIYVLKDASLQHYCTKESDLKDNIKRRPENIPAHQIKSSELKLFFANALLPNKSQQDMKNVLYIQNNNVFRVWVDDFRPILVLGRGQSNSVLLAKRRDKVYSDYILSQNGSLIINNNNSSIINSSNINNSSSSQQQQQQLQQSSTHSSSQGIQQQQQQTSPQTQNNTVVVIKSQTGLAGFEDDFFVAQKITDLTEFQDKMDFVKINDQIRGYIPLDFVVPLEYAFQDRFTYYFYTKVMKGGDLYKQLTVRHSFTEDEARFYFVEVLCALNQFHLRGVPYGDLKPENILLDERGHVALTDFGIHRFIIAAEQDEYEDQEDLKPQQNINIKDNSSDYNNNINADSTIQTSSNNNNGGLVINESNSNKDNVEDNKNNENNDNSGISGNIISNGNSINPEISLQQNSGKLSNDINNKKISNKFDSIYSSLEYTAPEVLLGKKRTIASDFWSLGALLYELVVGINPYYHENKNFIIYLIMQNNIIFPINQTAISQDCQNLIRALLQSNPEQRLGAHGYLKEIQSHKWLQNVSLAEFYNKLVKPPALKEDANNNSFCKFGKIQQQIQGGGGGNGGEMLLEQDLKEMIAQNIKLSLFDYENLGKEQ